jgi:hypothetical protein
MSNMYSDGLSPYPMTIINYGLIEGSGDLKSEAECPASERATRDHGSRDAERVNYRK